MERSYSVERGWRSRGVGYVLTRLAQYEALKKKNAKKAGGAAKKKDEKPEASSAAETQEEKTEEAAEEPAAAVEAAEAPETTSASPGPVEVDDDEPTELPSTTTSHGRKPSIAVESRQRSASFYRSAGGPTSPIATTPGGGVSSDIYREQAQRIEELEKENKRLASELGQGETRWKKSEEELEELREGRGEAALAAEKAKDADRLVRLCRSLRDKQYANAVDRNRKSNRSSDSFPNSNRSLPSLRNGPLRLVSLPPSTISTPKLRPKQKQLSLWSWKSRASTSNLRISLARTTNYKQGYRLWRLHCRRLSRKPAPPRPNSQI